MIRRQLQLDQQPIDLGNEQSEGQALRYGLRHHHLGRHHDAIDGKDGSVGAFEGGGTFIVKVGMAGTVHNGHGIGLAARIRQAEGDGSRFDGQPPALFRHEGVGDARSGSARRSSALRFHRGPLSEGIRLDLGLLQEQIDEGRLARVQMSDEGHPPPRQCGTATVSSHSDEDDSFSEISIATADAKPSGERRKPVSSFDLPSATPMVTSPMSVHTQYALTPSRSCPSFSNLQLSSPTILEPLPPTEPTERQIEREVEEHRRLACFLTYGEAPLPQDIKNYKSPTCSQRPEPRRKEKGVYLPFKQVPGWGSEVAVTTVLGMIEVDRQVREGRGAYPKGWRSRELGLYDNKTIEFSIALSTDKIALDAYKLGYEDGSKQPTAHPALTDNKLADAYGVKRGKIRQSLHAVWLSNDHKKAKEAKKNTGRNRRTKKPTVIKTNQCCCILHVDL